MSGRRGGRRRTLRVNLPAEPARGRLWAQAQAVFVRSDVDAAEQTVASFESRLSSVRRELSASEEAIGTLGREFTAAVDTLTRAIDQSAPAPSRPPVPADIAR